MANPLVKRLWFSIKDVLIPGNDLEVSSLAREALITLFTAYSRAPISEIETKSLTFLLESLSSSKKIFICNSLYIIINLFFQVVENSNKTKLKYYN